MSRVSVGQVENLGEAIAHLQSDYNLMECACEAQVSMAEEKLSAAQQEADNSAQLLESAQEAELEAAQQLEMAIEQLEIANDQLNSAYSALSSCEASGYDDEGPPDCSGEEADVEEAESVVCEAEKAAVDAERLLDEAKELRMQMEQRNELALRCLDMAVQLTVHVRSECSMRLSRAAAHLETGTCRLQHAQEALDAYHNANSSAAEFHSWLNWSPPANKPVTPKDIHTQLNLSAEQQRYYFEYLAERDPTFRAKIADYRHQLEAANGPAERHAVQLKMRRNLSGYCGEKIVEHALSQLGEKTETQSRTTFEDGRYTKTDLVIKELRNPVILGRGEGMSAPAGGSIAIEVKCGKSSYLYSEKDHMVFQSAGHKNADASMTICSRDIKNLTPQQEQELRDALREAGSPIIGMLPEKDEIDKACWETVTQPHLKAGGSHED